MKVYRRNSTLGVKKSGLTLGRKIVIITLLVLLSLSCFEKEAEGSANAPHLPNTVVYQGSSYIGDQIFALGTVISVKIYDSEDASILQDLFLYVEELEQLLSRTMPGSDIYHINREAGNLFPGSVEVSPVTVELLEEALWFSRLSDGRFDPTIAPLVALWDIGGENPYVPTPLEVEALLPYVNYKDVRIAGNRVELKRHMALDLGAIAKGFIGDKMAEFLQDRGVESALINLGGNVLTLGTKPNNVPFRIGIQNPMALRNTSLGVVQLSNLSVVSSGVYERYIEMDGEQYHHILDPSTGYPVENEVLQVSVLSRESVDGDGFSTALFSMGFEEGMALALVQKQIDVAFIMKDQTIYMTKGFDDIFTLEDKSFKVVVVQ